MKQKLLNYIYLLLAFTFLGLGIIGIALPVLPTTPFLLAASFFFAKGSKRFNKWFMSTNIYKNHIEEFLNSRAMTRKAKLRILIPVSIMLVISFLTISSSHVRVLIVFLFLFKEYYFRFHIRTIVEEDVVREKGFLTDETR